MARINAFLKLGREQGCSDLHLAVGVPPMLRMNGDLMPIKFRDLGERELEGYVLEILTPTQRQRFRDGEDLDFSYVAEEVGRFRVNLFRKATGVGATVRHVPDSVPSLDELGLPAVVRELVGHHQGMVLITGSTGTGSSRLSPSQATSRPPTQVRRTRKSFRSSTSTASIRSPSASSPIGRL